MSDSLDELKARLTRKREAKPIGRRLSSGLDLVNLSMSGDPDWAFEEGCYYLLVGGSRAGKTWICLTALAEASINPAFDGYRLIYDAPERGARMDIKKFFGEKLEKRVEFLYSSTVEDMYYVLDDAFADGRPFIFVEDSETSLGSKDAEEKFQEQKKAHRKGKDTSGSYGDGKAKKHSANLRSVVSRLDKTGSMLFLVAQSRDNIGFGAQFNPETRGGGRALTFYATGELWFKVKGGIKKTVQGKPRKIGTELEVKVKKNRDTGREPSVEVHHYPSVGLDNIGSNVSYLVEEKRWKSAKEDGGGKITAVDFGLEGTREKLVAEIEAKGLEQELKRLVVETWKGIESECEIRRKPKYGQGE